MLVRLGLKPKLERTEQQAWPLLKKASICCAVGSQRVAWQANSTPDGHARRRQPLGPSRLEREARKKKTASAFRLSRVFQQIA